MCRLSMSGSYSRHPVHSSSQCFRPHWSLCTCTVQHLTPAPEGSSGSDLARHTEPAGWIGWPLRFGTRWWWEAALHVPHTPVIPLCPAGLWPLWLRYHLWWRGVLEQWYKIMIIIMIQSEICNSAVFRHVRFVKPLHRVAVCKNPHSP